MKRKKKIKNNNLSKEYKKPVKIEKYKCIKKCFSKILIKNNDYSKYAFDKIYNAMIRTNHITIKTYQLLRLWILDKYHKNINIPIITEDTIKMCIKSILKPSKGPKAKGDNLLLLEEFINLHNFDLEDGKNICNILQYNATTILTCVENNIKANFFEYINRFINSYFKFKYQEEIKNRDFKINLFKELKKVKDDIKNNTLNCDKKYHEWLNNNRFNIVPFFFEENYFYDIKINPQKYIKYMIWMNIELEKINGKMYQFFPLQNNIIPKFIQIDTKSLIELLIDKDKNDYLKDIEHTKYTLWDKFLNIDVKLKNYNFDYTIITDCYSVSIRFLHKDFKEAEENKKKLMREARKKAGLNDIQKEEIKQQENNLENKILLKKEILDKNIKNLKISNKILNKKELNELIKNEQRLFNEEIKNDKKILKKEIIENKNNIKKTNKIQNENLKKEKEDNKKKDKDLKKLKDSKKENNKIKKENEFLYIDEVDKECFNGKQIFIDPGKRTLLYMIDMDGNKLCYTNRQRIKKTKRLIYQEILETHRDNLKITEIEKKLTSINSKTCNLDFFKEYIKEKNKINNELFKLYENEKFRRYKFYSHINKKREENNMLNMIEKKYGNNNKKEKQKIQIIIGDWSIGKQMRNFISTPNLGIKRKLQERFEVYNIDEYRTSCLNNKTEELCENLKVPDKSEYKTIRKIHSVLTYKMENNRKGCINRDLNGCLNIKKLFTHYLNTGERPLKYCRNYNLKKDTNPLIESPISHVSSSIIPT
jgi:hypothetical protein